MALHHHPELVRTTARPVIELAVSVMIAAHRLPEIIRPRRIFRDVGLLRAIAVARQIPVGQISGSNQTFTFSGIRFLLLTILPRSSRASAACRANRLEPELVQRKTDSEGRLARFENSQNVKMAAISLRRRIGTSGLIWVCENLASIWLRLRVGKSSAQCQAAMGCRPCS